jgi:hypothetical protein
MPLMGRSKVVDRFMGQVLQGKLPPSINLDLWGRSRLMFQ